MNDMNKLPIEELLALYPKIKELRINVLKEVQEYGYNVEQLVSRKFEHDIEQIYGRKVLESGMDNENQ